MPLLLLFQDLFAIATNQPIHFSSIITFVLKAFLTLEGVLSLSFYHAYRKSENNFYFYFILFYSISLIFFWQNPIGNYFYFILFY